jgi:hypothetical protein
MVLFDAFARFALQGRGTPAPPLPEHLVVSGLYRHVRNPMYLAVLTVVVGSGAAARRHEPALVAGRRAAIGPAARAGLRRRAHGTGGGKRLQPGQPGGAAARSTSGGVGIKP